MRQLLGYVLPTQILPSNFGSSLKHSRSEEESDGGGR